LTLTRHGSIRISQRHGKKGYKARELANRAFLNGKRRESLIGPLRKWVDRKYFKYHQAAIHIVHGGYLYIFGDNRELITTYRVPEKVLKTKKKVKIIVRQD
jgi:hypothetical protein